MKHGILLAVTFVFFLMANGQQIEKVTFNTADSASGYYLAIPPNSGNIRAVLVVFCAFRGPESILPCGCIWRIERYLFPPPFAPDVRLKGVEELRFPPGWGVAGSKNIFP